MNGLLVGTILWLPLLLPRTSAAPSWDTFPDTWVAVDALGRRLPTHTETGPPRPGKQVGIFYFLWLGRHGDAGPFDISRILAQAPEAMQDPNHPLWGPLYVPHHWGESIFGYYVGEDESVLAKHAQMLADAGIDAVIFDVTNQLTYPESWRALCRTWDGIRRTGLRVPQLAFLCPFGDPAKVVRELYRELYGPGLYPELWYRWQGRPLILADPAMLGTRQGNETHDGPTPLETGQSLGQQFDTSQALASVSGSFPTWGTTNAAVTLTLRRNGPEGDILAQRRFVAVPDNAWLQLGLDPPASPGRFYFEASDASGRIGWWSHQQDQFAPGTAFRNHQPAPGDRQFRFSLADPELDQIQRLFTFRKPQPDYFRGPTGPDQWGWLEVYPQHAFTNAHGHVEEVTVGAAQNALDGKLSVLSNPRSHGRSFHNGRQPDRSGQDGRGLNFAEQWGRAFALDPDFVFVTGWNEWIAGRFDHTSPFHGDGPVTFVDQFSPEYSRDIEPMKGGHGDNYYYQLVAQVRRFKGTRPLATVRSRPIRIDGTFEDWVGVEPEFRDPMGDPVHREQVGWDRKTRYVDHTGRNDLLATQLSVDQQNLYFHVRTQNPITPPSGTNWMLLFLDVDGNPTNGWLGYDFVVNRQDVTTTASGIERPTGPEFRWSSVGTTSLRIAGHHLELAVPLHSLGLQQPPTCLDFKWADNAIRDGLAIDFTLHGDVAPNDRFNYRAQLK